MSRATTATTPPAHVVVPCRCGCGLDVPEGRDLYATLLCNRRVQALRYSRRRLLVDAQTGRRVRRVAAALARPASEVLGQVLREALDVLEESLRDAADPRALVAALERVKAGSVPRVTAYDVMQAVEAATGVTVKELAGRQRTRRVSAARGVCAWVCRLGGLSLSAIGAALGGRDHTTVLYALGSCAVRLSDPAHEKLARGVTEACGLRWPA